MKTLNYIVAAAALLAWFGAVQSHATEFVVNGGFESPNLGGGWNLFTNGEVPGWNNTGGDGFIELDTTTIVGGSAFQGSQSAEVDANTFDTYSQVISGLTVGDTYALSWAYGDRPGSGPQALDVWLGGNLITTDVDSFAGNNNSLVWQNNSFFVTATSSTETLSFEALNVGGAPSVGNEIDAVSLISTPEMPTMPLLLTGLGVLGLLLRKQAMQS